jgi:hypothetical protein
VRDDRQSDKVIDALTEEVLLGGLAKLMPMVPSTSDGSGSEGQASQTDPSRLDQGQS